MTSLKFVGIKKRDDSTTRLLLFTVLNQIHTITEENKIYKKKLSNLLIELDKKGYNLTPIIENINGLTTPYLKYKLQDLMIFNILDHASEPMFITEEGLSYINKEIEALQKEPQYRKFLKITNDLIKTSYI
ncbi:MAG: hypothetical protein ACTSR5_07675 [Promethearchaeota archaeon]